MDRPKSASRIFHPDRRARSQPGRRLAIAAAVTACFAGPVLANPVNPQVIHGAAGFAQAGNILTVTNAPNTIIHWGSFSIAAGELTRFVQQSANSAVLNRVIGQDPSAILGALQSNGRVFLINPNGITFGAGAQIDVAGLVASTLRLSNEDFLAGRLRFTEGAIANNVINQGVINSPTVYLVGRAVSNEGLITSPRGEIVLAAGQSVELVSPATPHLRVEIVAPDNEARNLGTLSAEAGRIGIYAGLIRHVGTARADTAVLENGRIVLKATRQLELGAGSLLSAAAPAGGDGGFIETSAQNVSVAATARVTTQAASGHTGTWLIDPTDFTIAASGGNITGAALSGQLGSNNVVLATDAAGGGNGDIFVNDTVTWANANSLTLNAHRHIDFSGGGLLDGGSSGMIQLNAGLGGASGSIVAHPSNTVVRGNTLVANALTGIGSLVHPLRTQVAKAGLSNSQVGGIYQLNAGVISVAAHSVNGDIVVRTEGGANATGFNNPGGQAGGIAVGTVGILEGLTATDPGGTGMVGSITLVVGNSGNSSDGNPSIPGNGSSGPAGGGITINTPVQAAGDITITSGDGGRGGAGSSSVVLGNIFTGGAGGAGGNIMLNAALGAGHDVRLATGSGASGGFCNICTNGLDGSSGTIAVSAAITAGNDIGLVTASGAGAGGAIVLSAGISAARNLAVNAGSGLNGHMSGAISVGGALSAGHDLALSTGSGAGGAISVDAAISALNDLVLNAGGAIGVNFALDAGRDLSLNGGGAVSVNAAVDAGRDLFLNAGSDSAAINVNAVLNSGRNLLLSAGGGIGGGAMGGSINVNATLVAVNDLTLNAGTGGQGIEGAYGGAGGAISVMAPLSAGHDLSLIAGNGGGGGGSIVDAVPGGLGGQGGSVSVSAALNAGHDVKINAGQGGGGGGGNGSRAAGQGGAGGSVSANGIVTAGRNLTIIAGSGGGGGGGGGDGGIGGVIQLDNTLSAGQAVTVIAGINGSSASGINGGSGGSGGGGFGLGLSDDRNGGRGGTGTYGEAGDGVGGTGGDACSPPACLPANPAFASVTLGGTITGNGSGDAIRVLAGNFINNAGASAFSTPNGRWLVWSQSPVSNQFGGLQSGNAALWSAIFDTITGSVVASGNRFIFQDAATAGTAVVKADNQSKTYGDTFNPAGFTWSAFAADSGAAFGNAFTDAGSGVVSLTGTPLLSSAGAAATATRTGGNGGGAGYDITVNLGGVSAAGYTLQGVSGLLTVNRRTVSVTADAKNLTYGDALQPLSFTANNLAAFDNNTTAFTGALSRAVGGMSTAGHENAGTYAIGQGTLAANANYTVTGFAGANYAIAPRALNVAATGQNKVYDGGTTATVTLADNRLGGDSFTVQHGAAFSDKHAGTGKTVNVTGIALSGTDAGNYSANVATTATADITTRALDVGFTGVNRSYDATVAATVHITDNRIAGDSLVINHSAAFSDKDVGMGKTVNVSGVSLSGADAGNYTVAPTGITTAEISPALLTVRADDKSRLFNEPNPPLSSTIAGFVGGEGPGLLSGTLTLATTATAASPPGRYAITVTPTLFSAPNYTLEFVDGTLRVIPLDPPGGALNNLIVATDKQPPPKDGTAAFVFEVPANDGRAAGCKTVSPGLEFCF